MSSGSKLGDKVGCVCYLGSVSVLAGLLVLNVLQTHGNNVFRMQVALGMELMSFYCEDTT